MVGIVQLAEHRIVVPGVVGSSPITHPMKKARESVLFSTKCAYRRVKFALQVKLSCGQ